MPSDQNVEGARCIDIGSSTGGFTDCLLQAGWQRCMRRRELRTACLEAEGRPARFRCSNARTSRRPLPKSSALRSMFWWPDLSFIGLAGLAPVFAALLRAGKAWCWRLSNPQFESAHDETDRGIVRDETVRRRVVEEVKEAFAARGFRIEGSSKVLSRALRAMWSTS